MLCTCMYLNSHSQAMELMGINQQMRILAAVQKTTYRAYQPVDTRTYEE